MKIIKKIGIMFISIITYIQIFFYKVYAGFIYPNHHEDYGIREPSKVVNPMLNILGKLKILIIPVILLIGFIAYYKKSKCDKYKGIVKIAIFIMSIVIFVLLVLILASIIKKYRFF